MRRADMDTDVWYAINTGHQTQAGRIIDPGDPNRNKGKVLVVCDRHAYFGGDRDEVRSRLDRLADYDNETIVGVALDWTDHFTSVAALPKKPYYNDRADPRFHLEPYWVDTNDIGTPVWEHAEQVVARCEARITEDVARIAAHDAKIAAFRDRWLAVADLVDIVHPTPNAAGRMESELIPRLFTIDEHGRKPHLDPDHRSFSYEDMLDVFEAWAADRATVAAGPIQCRLAV